MDYRKLMNDALTACPHALEAAQREHKAVVEAEAEVASLTAKLTRAKKELSEATIPSSEAYIRRSKAVAQQYVDTGSAAVKLEPQDDIEFADVATLKRIVVGLTAMVEEQADVAKHARGRHAAAVNALRAALTTRLVEDYLEAARTLGGLWSALEALRREGVTSFNQTSFARLAIPDVRPALEHWGVNSGIYLNSQTLAEQGGPAQVQHSLVDLLRAHEAA